MFFLLSVAFAAPTFPVYGELLDSNGVARTGAVQMTVSLYDSEIGGTPLATETQVILVSAGAFVYHFGDIPEFNASLLENNQDLYLGIKILEDSEFPRIQMGWLPRAYNASTAENVEQIGNSTDFLAVDYAPDWADLAGAPEVAQVNTTLDPDCTGAADGTLLYDSVNSRFMTCMSNAPIELRSNTPVGASAKTAEASCNRILARRGAPLRDGVYWIDPDGNGAFEVYCNMNTDGGGWTRIYAEHQVPQDIWTAELSENALRPEKLLSSRIMPGTHTHLSKAQVDAIPFRTVRDQIGDTDSYGQFVMGSTEFNFTGTTKTSGLPTGAILSYSFGNSSNNPYFSHNPEDLLLGPVNSSGIGYFLKYGVRETSVSTCGTLVTTPDDRIRSFVKVGDYNNGCYQPLEVKRVPRFIWVR